MKLLRTIRLDPSDTFVFERAAEPEEWAVSGSFLFLGADPEALTTKHRHALRSGFLGTASLGFSTLAIVGEASQDQRDAAVAALAQAFLEKLGAPDADAAREAAEGEFAYAQSLSDHEVGTLIAVQRSFDAHGALREQFRTLRPRDRTQDQDALHAFSRAFTFHETDEEADEGPQESVDLLTLSKDRS